MCADFPYIFQGLGLVRRMVMKMIAVCVKFARSFEIRSFSRLCQDPLK